MAGINFISKVEVLNASSAEFPKGRRWHLASGEFVFSVVEDNNGAHHLEWALPSGADGFEDTISLTGGGYTGVSFKPESQVISLGTPASAMSPALVEWGLKQVENKENWFVRVDRAGLSEVEDSRREDLYQEALDVEETSHIGMEPASPRCAEWEVEGREFTPGRFQPRMDRHADEDKWASPIRSVWIRRVLPEIEIPSGQFVPDDAREKVLSAVKNKIYALPADDRQELAEAAKEAARETADGIEEREEKIREWKRDSRKREKLEKEVEHWYGKAETRQKKIIDLNNRVEELKREKNQLERELRHERNGSGKLGAVQALMDILDVSPSEAKEAVEAIE